MHKSFANFMNFLGFAWWVEIRTDSPKCTYYFGPFSSEDEAAEAKPGYVEDLQGEGAQGIQVCIKRCKPEILTITDEDELGEMGGKVTRSLVSPIS